MAWLEPKTNWRSTDYINVEDFNRIRGNIEYLKQKSDKLYVDYDFTLPFVKEMSMNDYAFADYWNNLEQALQDIVDNTYDMNVGKMKSYRDYQSYIDYNELNRIESACLIYHDMLETQERTVRRLAFTLGNEGVRI